MAIIALQIGGEWYGEVTEYQHTVRFPAETEDQALSDAQRYYDEEVMPEIRRDSAKRLISFAETQVENLTAQYPPTERDGWHEKLRIAKDILSGAAGNSDATFFAQLATLRGDADVIAYAERIVAKAKTFKQMSFTIHEIKNRALKDIANAKDEISVHALERNAETEIYKFNEVA